MQGVRKRQKGFALPSVIITALVMFTVLVAMVGSVASVRMTLDSQYNQALARDASESGITVANECLRLSNGVPGWSNAQPLTASTDCNGAVRSGCASGCFIVGTTGSRTDFRVGAPTVGSSGLAEYTSDGKTELLRKTGGAIWKTYNYAYAASEKLQAAPQVAGGSGWKEWGHIGVYITYTGQLYGFGDNSSAYLAQTLPFTAVAKPSLLPLPVGVSRASKVYVSGQGANIICMISYDQDAYCRGFGGVPDANNWTKFPLPGGQKAKDMYISGYGADSACVVSTIGQAFCIGENAPWDPPSSLLGTANYVDGIIPITAPSRFILPGALTVKSIYLGDRMACAIASDDNAYCAGDNGWGMLGQGNTNRYSLPVMYPLPGGRKAKQVISPYHFGESYTLMVLATDGTAWGSGYNSDGQLGMGTEKIDVTTPTQFGSRSDYAAMIAGYDYFCGITTGGEVWCAGDGNRGVLGNGACTDSNYPVKFNLPAGELASTDISPINNRNFITTQILTRSGKIYTAGEDAYGKAGVGSPSSARCTPAQMSMPSGVKAKTIVTLDEYSLYFIGSNGFLYGVGRNNVGQLGDGTLIDRYTPVPSVYLRSLTIY